MATTNRAAHIHSVATFGGVAYELHHGGGLRVFDVDAAEVVSMTFYPTFAAAEVAYRAVVAAAKATS